MKIHYLVLATTLMAADVSADSLTLDAAIGGGIGGAAGAAVATDDDKPRHKSTGTKTYYKNDKHNNATPFCPPGQAKKGGC